tara:strand:+ start:47 stop:535 length:489 start_codon:yes stop_codon:yes gene_type:complete
MIIIAIDPGFDRLGLAVIEKQKNSKERLLYSETFQTNKKDSFNTRLQQVVNRFIEKTREYDAQQLAIETLFFSTNRKTAMQVSEVRGALLFAAMQEGLEIFEYGPSQIKTAITGYGSADKHSMIMMVTKLIVMDDSEAKRHDDEYDAIACGLTHCAINNVVE